MLGPVLQHRLLVRTHDLRKPLDMAVTALRRLVEGLGMTLSIDGGDLLTASTVRVRWSPGTSYDGTRLLEITAASGALPPDDVLREMNALGLLAQFDRPLVPLEPPVLEPSAIGTLPTYPLTKGPFRVALVVVGPEGVNDHSVFAGRRGRVFEVSRQNLDVREIACDRGGKEETGLASIAMRSIGGVDDIEIWSLRAKYEWEAALGLTHLMRRDLDAARVVATNFAIGNDEKPPFGAPLRTLERTIDNAFCQGITFVAPAGNRADAPIAEPASFAKVITVGGWENRVDLDPRVTRDDWVWEHSSRGSPGSGKPTLLRGHVSRTVAGPNGREDTETMEGTSAAVGEAAGVIARLYAQNPDLSCDEIRKRLADACVKVRRRRNENRPAEPYEQGWGALCPGCALGEHQPHDRS